MGWSINLDKNTAVIPRECILDILKSDNDIAFTAHDWGDEDEQVKYLWDGTNLKFDCDHMEHMDYVWQVADILKSHQVKGDIAFSSGDGDNAGDAWCYRFDGKGGMEHLGGEIADLWNE
jgi:hypothetical protein